FPLRWEGFVPGVQLAGECEPPGHDRSPVVVVQRVLELEVLVGDFTGFVDLGVVVFGPSAEDVSVPTAVPSMLNEMLVDVAGDADLEGFRRGFSTCTAGLSADVGNGELSSAREGISPPS